MGIERILPRRGSENHGCPVDASRIVVEPMEMGFVSLRHFLLPARHCVEDGVVRRCAGLDKTHSGLRGTGVSWRQAGIFCVRRIRVGRPGRGLRHVFRPEHGLPYAVFAAACLEMRAKRKMAGMADRNKLRPLCRTSILHAFPGQHPLVWGIGHQPGRHVPVALGLCHAWMFARSRSTEEMFSAHGQSSSWGSLTFQGLGTSSASIRR